MKPTSILLAMAEDTENRECIICMDEPRAVRLPCGHETLCVDCAESLLATDKCVVDRRCRTLPVY